MSTLGCIDCEHYDSGIKRDDVRKCNAGNNNKLNAWWQLNGNKTRNDVFTPMPCFAPSMDREMLNDLIEKACRLVKAIADEKALNSN